MSTIAFSRQGSGPPVVLIHGIGHRRQAWGEVATLLARDFEVVAIDLPGHGESPIPTRPETFAFESVARQVEALVAHLGLDRPHVAGNSLGGYFALLLAARGSVASATCLSPFSFGSRRELFLGSGPQLLAMKAASFAPRRAVRTFADVERLRRISQRALYSHPERLSADMAFEDTLNLRSAKGFWPFFVRCIAAAQCPQPVVPVTIAWGETDRLLIPAQAARALTHLPNARHVPLPGCGHVPMLDHPELVAEVITHQVTAAETAARSGAVEAV